METMAKTIITIAILVLMRWGWELLNWAWLKPRKLENWLRNEGYKGNSYKLVTGDLKEAATMSKEARSKPMSTSHNITPHALPLDYHIINKYGRKSYMWFGPIPRIYIMDTELIKDILSRPNEFQKPHPEPIRDGVITGLPVSEGDKWTKHRQIINPAFHFESIKSMFSTICLSCDDMINKWGLLTAPTSSVEVDVWPFIDHLAGDFISRTAFGSCFEEGQEIFRIHKEQIDLATRQTLMLQFPGGRFIPTKTIKKLKEKGNELRAIIKGIINKRKTLAIHVGDGSHDDLLGYLLKSNLKEIEEAGVGRNMEDVIDECKLFYLAATETTATLILWTMVCLSLHQEWQTNAREEIMQAFGTGLKHLKNVTMILNEVLRLYPPVPMVLRAAHKDTKLGNMTIPSGMNIIIPILHVHHDHDIWGDDAREFKPERFSDGVANATKGRGSASYLPFGAGPRICIVQNFAITEAKAAIAKILQRFSFELSPSYKHSPTPMFALTPFFGAPLILRKI